MLDAAFLLRPGVALEEVSLADTESGIGFAPEITRITRTDGPRFTHEIDDGVRAVLAGLNPHGLPLRDVVGLLAASRGIADDAQLKELEANAASAVIDLVRHGVVIPADIAEVVTAHTGRKE